MSLSVDQLVGYQRAEFTRAAKLKNRLLWIQFVVALPAAISVFFDNGLVLYYLALAGAVLLAVYIWTDRAYRSHREAAECGRRATLIYGGFGETMSAGDQLRLRTDFRVPESEAKAAEKPGYFATYAASGPQRLGQMVEESAFWTEALQAASARFTGVIFALVIIAFLATAIWLPFSKPSALMIVARVFLALLVFLLSSDVYGSVSGYWAASKSVREIRLRLAEICARGYPSGDVLLAMADYNAAVEAAPLQIPFLYGWMENRLNAEWREYQANRQAACRGAAPP